MSETPKSSPANVGIVVAVIIVVIVGLAFFWLNDSTEVEQPVVVEAPVEVVNTPPVIEEPAPVVEKVSPEALPDVPDIMDVPEPEVLEVEESPLPSLAQSDGYLKSQLPELTWRKELLKLVITDDLIRRVVVFTDNFAQGTVAYEHTPFVQPNIKFSAQELTDSNGIGNGQWQWDESTARRFALYIDLLRSIDSEALVAVYTDIKPLINEAYAELGYEDQDFTDVLQEAIVRVLDMELPEQDMTLVRPSVMYEFKDESLESLPESDKLLLRIGRENLLVLKSVLLELSDELSKAQALE